MSELFLRGYNVSRPEIDRGDDFLTIDDANDEIRRVQVKTSSAQGCPRSCGQCSTCRRVVLRLVYSLKRSQLRTPDGNTRLDYMFMFRDEDRWRHVSISRLDLLELRQQKFEVPSGQKKLTLELLFDTRDKSLRAWGVDLSGRLGTWEDWPLIPRSPSAEALTD